LSNPSRKSGFTSRRRAAALCDRNNAGFTAAQLPRAGELRLFNIRLAWRVREDGNHDAFDG